MYMYAKRQILANTDIEDMRQIQNLYKQLYVDPDYRFEWEFLGPEDELSRKVNDLCLSAYMKSLKKRNRMDYSIRGMLSGNSREIKFEIDLENVGPPHLSVYASMPRKTYYKMVYTCAKSSDSYRSFSDNVYSWMNKYANYYEKKYKVAATISNTISQLGNHRYCIDYA